jgi:hypothetical protein
VSGVTVDASALVYGPVGGPGSGHPLHSPPSQPHPALSRRTAVLGGPPGSVEVCAEQRASKDVSPWAKSIRRADRGHGLCFRGEATMQSESFASHSFVMPDLVDDTESRSNVGLCEVACAALDEGLPGVLRASSSSGGLAGARMLSLLDPWADAGPTGGARCWPRGIGGRNDPPHGGLPGVVRITPRRRR